MIKNKRYKLINEFTKSYKWSFINVFFCILITSFITIVYPYLIGLLVDQLMYGQRIKYFSEISIIMVIIYIFETGLHLILSFLWPFHFTKFLLEIRTNILKKILKLKYNKLSKISVGSMISKINWEAEAFVELLHRNMPYFLSNTVKILLILLFIFHFNFFLGIFAFFNIIKSFYINNIFGKKISEYQGIYKEKYLSFAGWIFEILNNISDIKLLSIEKEIYKKFKLKIFNISKEKLKMNKKNIEYKIIDDSIIFIFNIIKYIILSIMVYKKHISIGIFICLSYYFEMLNESLKNLNEYILKIYKNFNFIDDLVYLFEEYEEDFSEKNIKIEKGGIIFKDLSFFYENKKHILKNFNFTINPKEKIAIVGKSGMGKSTIIDLLLNFLTPNSGEIKIDNLDINKYNVSSLRNEIGIIQQDSFIFEGTIRFNLLLANETATEEELLLACRSALLEEYLNSLEHGLDTKIGVNGIKLSGGEKQRLGIAKLFLRKSKILIFDESTSALDEESEKLINLSLEKLMKEKTCIIIAHKLKTILTADKIALLKNEKIIAYDKHENLMKNCEEYKKFIIGESDEIGTYTI